MEEALKSLTPSSKQFAIERTAPADWSYLAEGGATAVFAYDGPIDDTFSGRVLRLRKVRLEHEDIGPPDTDDVEEDPQIPFLALLERIIAPEFLPRLEAVPLPSAWLQAFVAFHDAKRPQARRVVDKIDVGNGKGTARGVLAPNLVGGSEAEVVVEIKPKWGFLPRPEHLSEETCTAKTQVCRFCMHAHLRAVTARRKHKGQAVDQEQLTYCPLDLFSPSPERLKVALDALWESWLATDGGANNLRIFVGGSVRQPSEFPLTVAGAHFSTTDLRARVLPALHRLLHTSHLLPRLKYLQRILDGRGIEALARSTPNLGSDEPEPTLPEWSSFLYKFVAASESFSGKWRDEVLTQLLSGSFKDCSIVCRPGVDLTSTPTSGPVVTGLTVIDLDPKAPDRLKRWADLDREIVDCWRGVGSFEGMGGDREKRCVE